MCRQRRRSSRARPEVSHNGGLAQRRSRTASFILFLVLVVIRYVARGDGRMVRDQRSRTAEVSHSEPLPFAQPTSTIPNQQPTTTIH